MRCRSLDLSSDPALRSGDDGEVHLPALISGVFEISTQRGAAAAQRRAASSWTARRWTASASTCPRRARRQGPAGGQAALRSASPAAGALEHEAHRGLYFPVALATDHEESSLVRGAQIGRDRGRVGRGPLERGAFSWPEPEGEATRPVAPAERSLKTEQRATRDIASFVARARLLPIMHRAGVE